MKIAERTARWRLERRVLLRVSRAAWRLERAERERSWALASARAGGLSNLCRVTFVGSPESSQEAPAFRHGEEWECINVHVRDPYRSYLGIL